MHKLNKQKSTASALLKKEIPYAVPTVKQFFINIKRDEIFSSLLHTTLPCKVVCYTVFYFRVVNKRCFCLRKSDVTRFAHDDVAPDGRNDVMFANCAEGTASLPKATSQGGADITCPQGQTSFG